MSLRKTAKLLTVIPRKHTQFLPWKEQTERPCFIPRTERGLPPGDIGYILLVKGYAANPNLFADCYGIGLYEENNVLYVACNITDANLFADEDLYIGFTNRMVINYDILRMDKNNEYHYVDGYDGIPALFDFDLDDSRADKERAEQYKAERPFMTYDEFEKALAEENWRDFLKRIFWLENGDSFFTAVPVLMSWTVQHEQKTMHKISD